MELSKTQVIIVGAGPTGATLALLLVQRGIAVTLIEAARDFRRVFRGEGLMPSGLEALAQMGLLDLVEAIPHRPLTGWTFLVGDRPLFRVDEPLGAARPCTLVSQPPLLEKLVELATQYAHFSFLPGRVVKELVQTGDRISGVVVRGDGDEADRAIAANLVIGADGRSSTLRQRAGLPLETEPTPIDVLWFKVAAHPRFVEDNVFSTVLEGDRVFSIFHGAEPGKLHIAWVLPADAGDQWKQTDWVAEFSGLQLGWLAEHFRTQGHTLEPPIKLSVIVGRCPQWWQPGLLLLGDAAHPMSPVRAQGINLALRDVIVAANHLVPLLQHPDQQPIDVAETVAELDAALPRIQAERDPEIIRAQALKRAEAHQGILIRRNPWVLPLLHWSVPILGPLGRLSWLRRQYPLRNGITSVRLEV